MTEKTSNTISERPIFIRIGLLWYKLKPMTLAQLWEVGAIVEGMDKVDISDKINPISTILSRKNDFIIAEKVIITLLFRKRWKRALFGKYIHNHLTMAIYKKIIDYCILNFQASFFLTSITFLKGMERMTSPTNTDYQTARGGSSEE